MSTAADLAATISAFDALIASAATPEQADDRRLLKAYFTDPAARKAMADHVEAEIARAERAAK
jgi:hypothetical protein